MESLVLATTHDGKLPLASKCKPLQTTHHSIISAITDGKVPYASARLYKDNHVLCAAQEVASDETMTNYERDSVVINKVYVDDLGVFRGKFRD